MRMCSSIAVLVVLAAFGAAGRAPCQAGPAQAFFEAHCIKCHGPDKQKGDITLHALAGLPSTGKETERWQRIYDVLQSGEMPPEDEPQPPDSERQRLVNWIDAELQAFVASRADLRDEPTARRLTNFEYHNTLRDLLGVELELTDNLPEDPSRPYRFHNNARFLRMGLEQIDRYLENARAAMAAAIVDPAQPKVHKHRQSWSPSPRGVPDPTGMQRDELGVYGNRNRTVANGMRVFEWPSSGTFRIRVKASAILPAGISEMPLTIRMGHDIVGVGVSSLSPSRVVGTLRLTTSVDEPQIYELTGRIENFPHKPEHRYRRGGKIDGRLVVTAPHYTITPVNAYDDGRLNDRLDPLAEPRAVVEWMEFEAPVFDTWPPQHHRRILFESPLRTEDPKAYVRAVLAGFLPRAFRRPVRPEELDRYVQIYGIVSEKLGLASIEAAMRETLAMALITPDFLYHKNGAGDPQHELASRLSYFLWGTMPDAELTALADAGTLADPEVLAQQAARMLRDQRVADFVRNFTRQWLALDKLRTVPIDLSRFPRFLYTITRGERRGQEVANRATVRDMMQAETVAFVGELIRRNASLLEIVDSDFAMLNARLAAHYGVAGVQGHDVQGHELRPVAIADGHHLGGLLTQGAFLVGTSTGAAPHPVYRAVWLREAILGEHVPDPPADVPALDDSAGDGGAQAVTLKDLLRLHRTKQSCRECHARLDPWGLPFEQYDATGRFRPMVPPAGAKVEGLDPKRHRSVEDYDRYLADISTVPVDASARLPRGPEVAGVAELKRFLLEHRRRDIAENLVRRLLSYAVGRDLTVLDRVAVKNLLEATESNGYRLADLILAVCQSPTFLEGPPR